MSSCLILQGTGTTEVCGVDGGKLPLYRVTLVSHLDLFLSLCLIPQCNSAKDIFWYNVLYPKQLYCYRSIIDTLREKIQVLEFINKCELWQNWTHDDDEKTLYSAGVMLSIVNLPRTERYTNENIILLSIIPGLKEPEKSINTFLQPLVDKLLNLRTGVVTR